MVTLTAKGQPKDQYRLLVAGCSMPHDLGYIDLEQKTQQTTDNPFGSRLSPMF